MPTLNKQTLIDNYMKKENVSLEKATFHMKQFLIKIASAEIKDPGYTHTVSWTDQINKDKPVIIISTGLINKHNPGPVWAELLQANTKYLRDCGFIIESFDEGYGYGGAGQKIAIQSDNITKRFNDILEFNIKQINELLNSGQI